MSQVHLAPMGYVYDGSLNRQQQPCAIGSYVKPERTLCGLPVPAPDDHGRQSPRGPVKVLLPHDHEGACKTCLETLAGKGKKPAKLPDGVQPFLFL